MSLSRPTQDDSEEDLLQLQEEFNASNHLSSVKLSRQKPPSILSSDAALAHTPIPAASEPMKKQSLFSERMKESKQYQLMPGHIMSEVKESTVLFTGSKDFVVMDTGFPRVHHRNDSAYVKPTPAKQQHQRAVHVETVDSDLKEYEGVHQENINTLSQMSAQEIEEARAELVEKLDPAFLSFIRDRAAKKNQVPTKASAIIDLPVVKTEDSHIAAFVKKYVPPSKAEYAKLEWMTSSSKKLELPINVSDPTSFVQQTLSLLRFNFKGVLIDSSVDVSTSSGLHHHSDEQNLAGYTLLELQHLSRSTFPAQRSLALTVLGYIGESVKRGTLAGSVSIKGIDILRLIEYYIDNAGIVLGFRMALDDEFESVVTAGLRGLLLYFETIDDKSSAQLFMYTEERISDKIERLDKRSFSMSRRSEMRFKDIKDDFVFNDKKIHAYTIEEIRDTIESDVILGLYASNIFLRLAYILSLNGAHSESILVLLCRAARHSSFITKYLYEIGIVQLLINTFLSVTVPFSESSESSARLVCMSIKLIRLIALPKRDTCVKVASLEISSILAKFIALPVSMNHVFVQPLSTQIKAEIFDLFTVFTEYRIDGHIFDDLRQLLTSGLSEDISTCAWEVLNARLRYIKSVSIAYDSVMQCGTQNDALRPFVSLVVNALSNVTFESSDCLVVEALKEGWTFVARYVELLKGDAGSVFVSFAETKQFVDELILQTLVTRIKQHDLTLVHNSHYGFWAADQLSQAECLVDDSLLTSAFAAYLEVMYQFALRSKHSMTKLVTLMHSQPLHNLIKQLTTNKTFKATERSKLRICMIGSVKLVGTWLKVMRNMAFLTDSSNDLKRLTLTCAVWLVSAMLPGDELEVKDLIDYILDTSYLGITHSLVESNALAHVKEMYYMNAFSEETLIHSQAFHNQRAKQRLMVELGSGVSLPMSSDWLFLPVSVIIDEVQMNPKSIGARVLMTEEKVEIETDNGEIVGVMMRIISRIQDLGALSLSVENLYVQLMQIYLLPALLVDSETEIFTLDAVKRCLVPLVNSTIASMCSKDIAESVKAIEFAAGGQAKFYQLYRDLVHQYASVSYGNASFGLLLLVPLSTCFSIDYRKMFWTELIDVLRGFNHDKVFSTSKLAETDAEMLAIYTHAIKDGKITEVGNPFLFRLANQ